MNKGPTASLIKYDPPVLASSITDKRAKFVHQTERLEDIRITQTDDILHTILPPRVFTEDSNEWYQFVSPTPATRLDVVNLQERLDRLLKERQARETGLCPIREELYGQAFDELIRQVTVNCAERGVLLLRVRDEMRMTSQAYQTLYESAIAYGMRKTLQAEQGRKELEGRLQQLEGEKEAANRQVAELKEKLETLEAQESERRAVHEKKHAEELVFLKKSNQQLKAQLESVLAPSS
ncbi:axonemal dynein light intermediate polypeptide [Carpediemonas membranifera]|uniref:Axonemal dynein light intermediate polypeptide n=1 Tax=Carpediemonas membranifera TaxID=201153 RepID=A0A8J6AZV7_9EUKA|nr:axonemal dynein light intermediate polypeptide [Carpediemonas membranifera]|eukprot:KAG9395415.1 axonemal dynein light intermediate polypeptide [Carpediemonas membranifera]